MENQRQFFRYDFPETVKSVSSDGQGRLLIPFNISHGGVGFYSGAEIVEGTTGIFNLMDFLSISVLIKHCEPVDGKGEFSGQTMYKIGAEFENYTLTPEKLIEFLENHLPK